MTINWQEVITSTSTTVGGNVVLIGAAAWLIKTAISNGLVRDAEAFKIQVKADADREIEAFRIGLQANANTEIERLKNALQLAADERRVRFSNLHETRAKKIAELYERLVAQSLACQRYVFQMNEADRQMGFHKLEGEFLQLFSFIETIRIYLPVHICILLDNFVNHIRQPPLSGSCTAPSTNTPDLKSSKNEARP
jgi:hypothetical protein